MIEIDNIKRLISEGKTKEALDTFQQLLQGTGRAELNQSLLLESQYNDVVKKMQLGLADAQTELSRINFALLTLCDEVDKAGIKPPVTIHKTISVEGDVGNASVNPLVIFAVVIIVALAIIFFVITAI